jgi:hypothetical protein
LAQRCVVETRFFLCAQNFAPTPSFYVVACWLLLWLVGWLVVVAVVFLLLLLFDSLVFVVGS